MRSAPGNFWQKESTPFHYVTIPIGKGYSGAPPQGDAVTALTKYSAVLRDREVLALNEKTYTLDAGMTAQFPEREYLAARISQ